MRKIESVMEIPRQEEQEKSSIESKKERENPIKLFQREENQELEKIESKSRLTPRLKKAVCSITAGLILLTAIPAFGQEKGEGQLTEKQKIELQILKLQEEKEKIERKEIEAKEEERFRELENYLNYFNIEGLKLGKVQMKAKCLCEQYGIYLKGEHLDDIYSNFSIFSRQEFMDDVAQILREAGIRVDQRLTAPEKAEKISFKMFVKPEALEIIKRWGGKIEGNVIDIGNPDNILTVDKETKSVEIVNAGITTIIITVVDYDGSRAVVTCQNRQIKSLVRY